MYNYLYRTKRKNNLIYPGTWIFAEKRVKNFIQKLKNRAE